MCIDAYRHTCMHKHKNMHVYIYITIYQPYICIYICIHTYMVDVCLSPSDNVIIGAAGMKAAGIMIKN